MKDMRSSWMGVLLIMAAIWGLSALGKWTPSVLSQEPQERAITALEQDVHSDPNNSELWMHLGFAYRRAKQLDRAQEAFEKAVALNPRSVESLSMLGLIYESKHMDAAAEKAWQDYLAIETDPNRRAIAQKHIHRIEQ